MKSRQNRRRAVGVTARKREKRVADYMQHRGQFAHCYGERCTGDSKCGCGCNDCRMLRPSTTDERRYHVVAIISERSRFADKAKDVKKVYMTRFSVTHSEGCTILGKMTPRDGTRYLLEEVSPDGHESPSNDIDLTAD